MAESSFTQNPRGLSPDNCNYLKCWFTLIHNGKEVLLQIFKWGYKRPTNEIKAALFEQLNYSNTRYRSDFNASQRSTIESGKLEEFDVNLLFLLLQRICSLPPPSDREWGKEGDPESLPTLLYQIKMKRNTLAHTKIEMNDAEMLALIDELRYLFRKALNVASALFRISDDAVREVKEKINHDILSLQSTSFTISEQDMRAIAQEKAVLAMTEAQMDLKQTYKSFLEVLLAPWTVAESFRNIKDVFTEPMIKQTKNEVLFQQLTEEDSEVKVEGILNAELPDGSTPNFILVLSPSGMGKTTLVKYIIQLWMEKEPLIKGLESVDLILYMDCRTSRAQSFDDYLCTLIPNTMKLFDKRELKVLITTMQILVILDNIDEITDEALPTFEELLGLNSDNFRILATSTQPIPRTMSKKYHQRHLRLQLEGIASSNIGPCISRMYTSLYGSESNISSDEAVEMFISEYISKTNLNDQESIRSPEILSHVFFHWLMQSKENHSFTTNAQLFLTTHDLLCLKLTEKFGCKSQTNLFEQKIFYDKLKSFFEDFFRIAFQTFASNYVSLERSAFKELMDTCGKVGIPHSILREILIIKERTLNPHPFGNEIITFPSNSLHIFYCAMHVATLLTSEENINLDVIDESFFQTTLRRNCFILFIKFLIGILTITDIISFESKLEDIFSFILKYFPNAGPPFWVQVCEETRCHASAMAKARKRMGNNWCFEDQEISAGLMTMLQNYPPNQLTLTACKPPSTIFCLKRVLQICSSIPYIEMSLHLYHHFWVEKTEISDTYLEILMKEKRIQLDSFAGRLSSEYLLRVPISLKRLALHIKPEGITILNTALTRLKSLVLLYLNLDITFDYPAKRIPRLKLPNSNILVNVDFWNTDETHLEWTIDAVASFSSAYCRLSLRKSSLDYELTKAFLEGLRNRRVHVDTLVVGSIKTFSEEEEKTLSEIACDFECSEVKLIRL